VFRGSSNDDLFGVTTGSGIERDVMTDIFHSIMAMPAPFNMVVLIVLIGAVAGAVKLVATEVRRFGCHRQEIDFKREMVERGLSAEEIERILAAGSSTNGPTTVHVGNYVVGDTKSKCG
jgi:hypothetical protein